ncbi:MAG: hypothetical protein KGL39_37655 [Patescibacteria group bacterium]|nr:hypothetical protein [Patescibacteria group bacterium]
MSEDQKVEAIVSKLLELTRNESLEWKRSENIFGVPGGGYYAYIACIERGDAVIVKINQEDGFMFALHNKDKVHYWTSKSKILEKIYDLIVSRQKQYQESVIDDFCGFLQIDTPAERETNQQ